MFDVHYTKMFIVVGSVTGFCRIFATELEDRRPKTVPYLEEVVE